MPLGTIKFSDMNERPDGLFVIGRADAEDAILDFMVICEKLLPKRPLPAMTGNY